MQQDTVEQEQSEFVYYEDLEHSDEPIWVNRNATARDVTATNTFISMVGSEKYQSLLSDRKTPKYKVWRQIYKEMTDLGYHIADRATEGGAKCSQKWRNLERSYMQFVGHLRSGEENRIRPVYYELLHPIFKDTPKMATVEQKLSCRDQPETSPGSCEDNNSAKLETTSEATPQDILDFVVMETQRQEKRFTKLCELIEKQNVEKKRLTDAIIKYLGQSMNRKRKASKLNSD